MLSSAVCILKEHQKEKLVVGVSGGVDSMSLLWLVLDCKLFDKGDISAVHIDHNLRDSSKRDRDLVQEFCKKNGIGLRTISADVSGAARQNKRSIETEARLIRHKIFFEECKKNNARLVLAHTMDDQAETVLMHIFRGCGLNGLIAMSASDNHIIRPFIGIQKSDIYQFAKTNNIPFFEDETNQDAKYSRNLIRQLLQSASVSYPCIKENIFLLSGIAKKANSIILDTLDKSYFSLDDGTVLLNKEALKTSQASYYIMQSAKMAGLKQDLESRHIQLVESMKSMPAGKRIELVHGLAVHNQRQHLAFEFAPVLPPKDLLVPFVEGENDLFGIRISATPCNVAPSDKQIIVDADKLKGAVLRFRRDGDRFIPFGGRQKKLKEYLNDIHYPNRKKDLLPLICDGNQVLVIVGVQLSDTVRLDKNTKRAIRIQLL